jgi:elongation factor G
VWNRNNTKQGGLDLKEYKSDKIRNVGIFAHGGAGKTSLAEALLYTTGAVTRLGKVDDGTATTDFEPEEIKRKVTISTGLAPCEWRDHKINFLDTPGYADFVAEVKGSLRAVDAALVVLCAASGVEVGTENVWKYAVEAGVPRIAFINKMDRENADFFAAVDQMKEKFGHNIVPIQIPIGAQDSFKGVVDLVKMKAYTPANAQGTQYTESEIPADLKDNAEEARLALIEAAAETDDDLLTKYLEGEELSDDEIRAGLVKGVAQGKFCPVLCGAAYKNIGVQQLLDAIIAYAPSPEHTVAKGHHPATKEAVERKITDPFAAMVFKTTADPFVGRLSYVRVFAASSRPTPPFITPPARRASASAPSSPCAARPRTP